MGLACSADDHFLASMAVLVWPTHLFAVCLGYEGGCCPGLVPGGRDGRGRLGLGLPAIRVDNAVARLNFAGPTAVGL